jgi:hypothetical protein
LPAPLSGRCRAATTFLRSGEHCCRRRAVAKQDVFALLEELLRSFFFSLAEMVASASCCDSAARSALFCSNERGVAGSVIPDFRQKREITEPTVLRNDGCPTLVARCFERQPEVDTVACVVKAPSGDRVCCRFG